MEIQFGPTSVDEPSILYKLQRKIKVFNTNNPLPNRGYNLVASSSKYGIVFIASPDGALSVYNLNQLIDKESEPVRLSVPITEKLTHIAVSCDQELLAVTGGQLLHVYKITDFQNQNASPAVSVNYDVNPSTFVSALQWNPCIPDTIAIAFYDGTLLVSQVTSSQIKKVQSKARCICWSPKGKQLVTGNSDGTLCQYKPDLTPAKLVPAPNLFEGAPVEALAIYWISTYQFAVVYKNAADNSRPAVTIVNTPKAGQPSCMNYEDICYSMGSNRPWYYYLQGLAQWNMILTSSSNSMEIATLGSADANSWFQWCQPDEARPELPLTDKKQENYPVGICIDTCAIHQLPWGENDTLPHMPLLLVVSQSGLLTIFNIINLNKEAPQICSPPQQLPLPVAAMVSDIPDSVPQAAQPPPAPADQPKPQVPVVPQNLQPQHIPPTATPAPATPFAASGGSYKVSMPNFQQPPTEGSVAAVPPQAVERKPVKVKPVTPTVPQPQAVAQPKTPPTQPPKAQSNQAQEVNAALKAEQEKMNRLKADQELRSMLVKEVNDFQMELYKFVVKTRDVQIKLQNNLNTIDSSFNFQSLDTEKLRSECSMDELRAAIVQLKLELVRACAVVAEARTQAGAKELHQWTQADPLTAKRVASVKKLAYYVQTQLEQAQKALDYKWNEMTIRDSHLNKPGQRMIRPILDDVYQPLVKQQEILSKQQAVLRTLRGALKECDDVPVFKSTSLLRSTPFRNKDPLSKLTKNILNMSIESQTNKPKEALLTPQKLDALRDMLSNHKPIKIKPVNVELRQHLAAMRLNYEKSVKEKAVVASQQDVPPQQTSSVYPQPNVQVAPTDFPKPDLIVKQAPINIPSFTPLNNAKPGMGNVARTLFTDEPKQEPVKPMVQQPQFHQTQQQIQQQIQTPHPQIATPQMLVKQPQTPEVKPQLSAFNFGDPTPITATTQTRSILKDMLQNKMASVEAKNDANTFMGQKICSPTPFSFSSLPQSTAQQPTISFTSKPISDLNNMFNKFTQQPSVPDPKSTIIVKPKPDETNEPQATEPKPVEVKKEQKPLTNLFGMKTSTPLATNSQNVPDVLKSNSSFAAVKTENKSVAPPVVADNLKENVSQKHSEVVVPKAEDADRKAFEAKPLSPNTDTNKSLFASTATLITSTSIPVTIFAQKPVEVKTESDTETPKVAEKSDSSASSSPSSLFAVTTAANVTKSQSIFGSPTSSVSASQSSIFGSSASSDSVSSVTDVTSKEPATTTTAASASFIFSSAVASQPTVAQATQSGSIFTSTPSSASSVFASAQSTLFGTATTNTQSTTSSVYGTSTTSSAFGTDAKPSVFSTPLPSTPSSVFGAAATSASSVFGSTAASVFAGATTKSSSFGSSTTSVFGSPTATQASVFGSTPTTAQSVFGAAAATTQSIFGETTTTTQSIFGGTTPTTQSSVFGGATTTTQSVFGTTTATTQGSIFGGQGTAQTSVFGSASPQATTQASVFGTPTTQASVFGTPAPTTQASVFGSSPQATQASVFGTATATTQASVFGTPPATTAQSGSLFGGAESNLFASASISTTNASSPGSGGSIFSGGSSGSVFGSSNTNVFGGKTAFSQSNPTAAAIFGGGGASFSQKPANNFWASGNANSSTGFGSSFGQQATTQASSIFGGSSGGSFSSPSGGQAFGSPQPTGSVFGSPQPQAASAFGGSPVFASKPVFGQSTGFGTPPSAGGTTGFGGFGGGFNKSPGSGFGAPAAFGGGATFGGTAFGGSSPGKMFGGSNASSGFGSPTQSNATFESLATQNTLTFGNLAQQTPQAPQAAPTFNTSPQFTGWRG